ncbi:hypothetical protein V1511DRAFT_520367 [Dipodascopsis uninucleata]
MPLANGAIDSVSSDPNALLKMLDLNDKVGVKTNGVREDEIDDDEVDALNQLDDIDDVDSLSGKASIGPYTLNQTTHNSPLSTVTRSSENRTGGGHLLHAHPQLGADVGSSSVGDSRFSRPASPYTLNPPIDFDGLSWPSIGTRSRLEATTEETQAKVARIADAVRIILTEIGEDPNREGLLSTPERYAKAIMFFTKGYEQNIRTVINRAVFEEDHDEMVIVKDIPVFSLCEHHMVPFTGTMSIGYIPNSRVLGLSKLARIAEMFARRLQVQERLTKQVALAVWEILRPQGVAVVMEASHMCMVMRGVQKPGSSTVTSCMLGRFREAQKTREEFFSLVGKR